MKLKIKGAYFWQRIMNQAHDHFLGYLTDVFNGAINIFSPMTQNREFPHRKRLIQ